RCHPPPVYPLFPYTTLFRSLRRDDGVAAVGDVAERAAVNERRPALERLDEVGIDRVLQKQGHRTVRLQVARPNGRLVGGESDDRSEEHTSELQSRFDLVCRL